MSQGHEVIREWEAWMDNMIVEDTFQKEHISFYQFSEFDDIKLISRNVYKATFKTFQKTVVLKYFPSNDKFVLNNLISEVSELI